MASLPSTPFLTYPLDILLASQHLWEKTYRKPGKKDGSKNPISKNQVVCGRLTPSLPYDTKTVKFLLQKLEKGRLQVSHNNKPGLGHWWA